MQLGVHTTVLPQKLLLNLVFYNQYNLTILYMELIYLLVSIDNIKASSRRVQYVTSVSNNCNLVFILRLSPPV